MSAAPRSGANASNTLARSACGLNTCICPAKTSARYPSPAKAKLLCPLGKLLHPSWRVWWFVSVQVAIVIKVCCGVPPFGLHLAIKSGRGRPTEFFTTSVRNEERVRLMKRPKMVTWVLCTPGWKIAAQRDRMSNGKRPAYAIFQPG